MRKIFVFGSNITGRHGAGAALTAVTKWKAIQGVPMGLQGNAYAIATKDLEKGERSVPLPFIAAQIQTLYEFANINPKLLFYLTRIGCGHAGFCEFEIGPLVGRHYGIDIPDNIVVCPEFATYVRSHNTIKFETLND